MQQNRLAENANRLAENAAKPAQVGWGGVGVGGGYRHRLSVFSWCCEAALDGVWHTSPPSHTVTPLSRGQSDSVATCRSTCVLGRGVATRSRSGGGGRGDRHAASPRATIECPPTPTPSPCVPDSNSHVLPSRRQSESVDASFDVSCWDVQSRHAVSLWRGELERPPCRLPTRHR